MMLGMGFSCEFLQAALPQQQLAIRHAVSHLLQMRLNLQSPNPPEAVRGLEGMKIADRILKERNATGILIGGCAEAVWSLRRTEQQLAKRKDVDVLVVTPDFELRRPFEGGIDWWLRGRARIREVSDASSLDATRTWWANGHGTVLRFTPIIPRGLPHGLLIPGPEWVLNMRLQEALPDGGFPSSISLDNPSDANEPFKARIARYVRTRVPKFIRDTFPEQIMDSFYGASYLLVQELQVCALGKPTLLAIARHLSNLEPQASDQLPPRAGDCGEQRPLSP